MKGAAIIQSFVFPRGQWTKNQAIQWMHDHGFPTKKVDVNATQYRFRQRPPSACKPSTYGTKIWWSKKKGSKTLPKPKKILVVFCGEKR